MIFQLSLFCLLFSSSVFAFPPLWNNTDCLENPDLRPCPLAHLEGRLPTASTNRSSNITWTPYLNSQNPVSKAHVDIGYVTRITFHPKNGTKVEDFMNSLLALIQEGLFNLEAGDLLLRGLDTLRKRNCSLGLNYYVCTLGSENVTALSPVAKWEPVKLKLVIIAALDGQSAWVYTSIDRPRWSAAPEGESYILLPPTAELNCTKWLEEHPIDKLEKPVNGTIRIPRCWLKHVLA